MARDFRKEIITEMQAGISNDTALNVGIAGLKRIETRNLNDMKSKYARVLTDKTFGPGQKENARKFLKAISEIEASQ
jgi:hypothetical protein